MGKKNKCIKVPKYTLYILVLKNIWNVGNYSETFTKCVKVKCYTVRYQTLKD